MGQHNELRRVATLDSAPQIKLVVLDPMLLEKLHILFLKRPYSMVLALVLNVVDHQRQVCLADRECTVSILPGEVPQTLKFIMNPFR